MQAFNVFNMFLTFIVISTLTQGLFRSVWLFSKLDYLSSYLSVIDFCCISTLTLEHILYGFNYLKLIGSYIMSNVSVIYCFVTNYSKT